MDECVHAAQISPSNIVYGQSLRGGMYLAARYGLGVVVSVGNMLVLTWWIGPHVYGVFVTSVGIVAFLAALARGGVDTCLVRNEVAPDDRMYGTAATLIFSASMIATAVAAVATPFLIRWYGSKEFVAPYVALLVTIPVTGLAGIPMAKLERALNFRAIATIELAAQVSGLIVSALLAWSKAGVWAPVFGQIAWQCITLVAASVVASMSFRLRFERPLARDMISYGMGLTASLRTWQLRTLINPLLVGRFAGAEGVAFVALAIRIAESLGAFRLAAGRIAIAALSRLQRSEQAFRDALQHALYLQVITLGPLLCGFALAGPYILPHALGPRWMSSLTLYPFIAAGVLVNSVYNLQASALFVVGKQWIVMQSYSVHVVLLALITLALLPRFGIVGYGWAELGGCAAYFSIHAGLRRKVVLSYTKFAGYLGLFIPLLFLPSTLRIAARLIQ